MSMINKGTVRVRTILALDEIFGARDSRLESGVLICVCEDREATLTQFWGRVQCDVGTSSGTLQLNSDVCNLTIFVVELFRHLDSPVQILIAIAIMSYREFSNHRDIAARFTEAGLYRKLPGAY
ncbi:unnamed protein product [Pieris macdunnoughi]|uniref:Uncharacterized protein n=1 Tax=Pieris macdunnoughi TaxID=345717 RepID=A0A821SYI1_9NEOP|nr:unnamed protein product [Pieris macdunnoughi]